MYDILKKMQLNAVLTSSLLGPVVRSPFSVNGE